MLYKTRSNLFFLDRPSAANPEGLNFVAYDVEAAPQILRCSHIDAPTVHPVLVARGSVCRIDISDRYDDESALRAPLPRKLYRCISVADGPDEGACWRVFAPVKAHVLPSDIVSIYCVEGHDIVTGQVYRIDAQPMAHINSVPFGDPVMVDVSLPGGSKD